MTSQSLRRDITDIQTAMAVHDPLAGEPLDRATQQRLRDIHSQLANGRAGSAAPAGRQRPVAPRLPVLRLAAAAATVTAAAVAVTAVGFGHERASASPTLPKPLTFGHGTHDAATEFLRRVAAAQERSNDGSGSVRYARTQSYALQVTVAGHKASSVVQTTVRDVWLSPDGSARVREFAQATEPAGGYVGGPKAVGGLPHGGNYPPGQWADLNTSFPTSTPAVRAALVNHWAGTDRALDDILVASAIDQHLLAGTATAAQRGSLISVLATLPETFDAGDVTDSTGRPGHAIGIITSGPGSLSVATTYFVFAEDSGQLLETETVDSPNPPPALHLPPGPAVEQYDVLLASAAVAKPGDTAARPA